MLSKLSARIEQILQLHLADTLRKTLQWQIYYVYAAHYLRLGKITNCQLPKCTRTNNLCSRFAKLMRCSQGFEDHNAGIKIRFYNASSIMPRIHLYICAHNTVELGKFTFTHTQMKFMYVNEKRREITDLGDYLKFL